MFLQLLVTLGIFDVLFISNGGLFMIQQAFNFNVTWYNILFPKLIYPISGFAMTGKKTEMVVAFLKKACPIETYLLFEALGLSKKSVVTITEKG